MADLNFPCRARMEQAVGRKLTDAELTQVFEKVHAAALQIKAGKSGAPDVTSKLGPSAEAVMNQVATEAARGYIAEALRVQRNTSLQVIKQAGLQDAIDGAVKAGLSNTDALSRLIVNRADGRMNVKSLENRYLGVESDLKRGLNDTWTALGPDFLGFVQNADNIKLLIREMRGEDTGNALAKKGAEGWKETTERARKWFNDSGGDIGKIDDWGLPQHHSQERVARAGKDTWVNAVMPALDRAKYVDDAGRAWSDVRLKDFLEHAWETIATNGYSKLEPGKFMGTGATANRGSEARMIHFKSADAYMEYWGNFGEKTFPQILMGHIEGISRDIAMVDHFGPNADANYRTLRDAAVKAEVTADPSRLGAAEKARAMLDKQWNQASGKTIPVADTTIAAVFDNLRNLNVAAKLGSAVWSSVFGDKVMLETMGHLNNLPEIQRWRNELALLNPLNADGRQALQRQGLMLDYMSLAMSRWGDQLGSNAFTGKLAGAIMRVSGMNAINTWRRGSFGLSIMDALGRSVEAHDFAAASATDMHLLKSMGVTELDWRVWKLAKLEDYGGGNNKMLTPDAIAGISDADLRAAGILGAADGPKQAQRVRQQAVVSLLGSVNSESRYAVVEPGWRERAQLLGGVESGTMKGELTKAFFQFKSFPIAQLERVWDVAMSRPSFGGKIGVLSAVMAMQTLAGMMIVNTQDLLAGKDPRPVDWKFGLNAFIKGGALGIYGDFLYGINETRVGSGLLESAAGPTIGPAVDFLTSTMNAAKQASEGKETHLMAKYVSLAKGFIPANNLWYTKAATDHIIFQNIQEALSPGYLAKMRARTQREYGQGWWWEPGEAAPSRAPDVSNMGNTR